MAILKDSLSFGLAQKMLSRIIQEFTGGKSMATEIYIVVAAFVSIILFLFGWIVARAYFRFRATRLVTCPGTGKPAAVKIDAKFAALTAPLGEPALRLEGCSRWPQHQDCGQQCLEEIEAAPENCLVRTILTRWYKGKSCILCGKDLGEIKWSDHKPALMSPQRVTLEWSEISPEKVPEVLATHMPVCWDCHIVQTFRRRYPKLVVDRPWKPGESHRSG